MKIVPFKRKNWRGQTRWYFRLQAKNGEIVAQSEGYNSKQARDRGMQLIQDAGYIFIVAEDSE